MRVFYSVVNEQETDPHQGECKKDEAMTACWPQYHLQLAIDASLDHDCQPHQDHVENEIESNAERQYGLETVDPDFLSLLSQGCSPQWRPTTATSNGGKCLHFLHCNNSKSDFGAVKRPGRLAREGIFLCEASIRTLELMLAEE